MQSLSPAAHARVLQPGQRLAAQAGWHSGGLVQELVTYSMKHNMIRLYGAPTSKQNRAMPGMQVMVAMAPMG